MMTSRYGSEQQIFSRILMLALAIGAATGWGMWYVSSQRSDRIEHELREQISTLAKNQMQYLHEREVAEAAKADLKTLQSRVSALRKEIEDLSQRRDQMQAAQRAAQSEGGGPTPNVEQADTGSTTTLDDAEKMNVSTAQRALTKLGYGPLTVDGIMGPSTQLAIEEFQYKNGLPVTRKLDTPTLQRLGEINSVAAAE
jgi:chromosome segregation ATPase